MTTGKRRAPARRRVLSARVRIGVGLAIFVVVGYVTLCLLAGDKVPAGTTVAGVSIGGLRAEAADRRLRDRLAPRFRRDVQVVGADAVDTTMTPSAAGVRLDVDATVRAAGGGRKVWPASVWRYYVGGDDRPARLAVDRGRLARTVTTLADRLDKKPVQGDVAFTAGTPAPIAPQDGRRTDRAGVRRTLLEAALGSGTVRLPYTVLRPTVRADAVQQAMNSFATPATSGPVQLGLGRHAVTAPPTLFTTALSFKADGDRLVPNLDVDRLIVALEPVLTTVAGSPQPARFEIRGGRPRVVPSRVGVTFDRADLQRKFLAAVVRPLGQRRVAVAGVDAPPSFTTADARALGVRRQVASLTTTFGFADYRNTNIARGVALLDGTILKPGSTLSFEDIMGAPTAARGFTPGFELSGGVFKPDPGAGLSQLATTLYAAAYRAGFKDAGRVNGAVHNDRLPLGLEVTVDHGDSDLKITDDTSHGVLVTASMTPSSQSGDGSVTVTLWSTPTWDVAVKVGRPYAVVAPKVRHRKGATCSATVGTQGFSVDVVRAFRKPGATTVDHRDKTTTIYPAQNTIICGAP